MIDHLRAAFFVLHLAAIGLLCLPAPVGALNQRSYNDPNVQAIFHDYATSLQGLGLDVGATALQDKAWRTGRRLLSLRRTLVQPLRPYTALTGSHQGWRMFGMVNRQPARLEVHVQTHPEGPWQPVYAMRSPKHNWRRFTLDQERVRGLFNDFSHLRNRRRFRQVSGWFAREILAEHPAAARVRVSMVLLPSPDPTTLRRQGRVLPSARRWSITTERGETPP